MFLTNVSFPSLGLDMEINPVAFSIGGKEIYWYGIILALGYFLAVVYALRRVKAFGLTEDHILDGLLIVTPIAIICARAYFCIFNWELFADNPISCLYIWEGGIAIYGSVIGAVVSTILYAHIKKVPLLPLLDLIALGFMIGQFIGRWGNFVNCEAHGGVTDSFLRMGIADALGNVTYYHPTFLYESVWNFVGFLFLHFYSKHRKYDGQIFTMYVAWYGLGRAFIEGLRTDSLYLFQTGIRVSQLLAAVSFVIAGCFLVWCLAIRKPDPAKLYVNQLAALEAAKTAEEIPEETTSEDIVNEIQESDTEI